LNTLIRTVIELIAKGIVVSLFLVVFVVSASKILNTPLYIEPEFRPIFNQFTQDAEKYKTKPDFSKLITIFKDELSFGTAAYCLPNTNTVVVSYPVYNGLSDNGKKALLYHEWGHCTLKRDHVEKTVEYKSLRCPVSLMYPYIDPVEFCYPILEDLYTQELFTNPYNFKKISEED